MFILIVFIKANYRQLLLAAGESDTENNPCELCFISPVEYEWSGPRSSAVILQVHHSARAIGLSMGKTAGLPSFQEPQAHFSGPPSLTSSCTTQCRSPSRACRGDRNTLKTTAFPLQFHLTGPCHTHWGKSHQHTLQQMCVGRDQDDWGSSHLKVCPLFERCSAIYSQILRQHVWNHVHVGQLPSAWFYF